MFVMVDYVQEMAVKKSCKYAEYGSCEHLLFLYFLFVCLFVLVLLFSLSFLLLYASYCRYLHIQPVLPIALT